MILDLQDAEPDNATELQMVDRRGGLPVRIENRVADPGFRLPGRRRLLAGAGGIVGNQGIIAHNDPSFPYGARGNHYGSEYGSKVHHDGAELHN